MATPCDDFAPELVAYLDGELDEAARRPIAAHLSTCLGCRRELEHLTTVRRWIGERPSLEPSADFAADFWRRLEHERGPAPRGRSWWWAAPALAAAAALALVLRSFIPAADVDAPARPPEQVAAPAAPAPARPAEVAEAQPAPRVADEPPARVAEAPELAPEDLPPELLEHPELFLRLPVVQRLETLEHFDEVRRMQGDDGSGGGEGRG